MNSMLIALNVIRRMFREISALGFLLVFPILGGMLAIAMVGSTKTIDIAMASSFVDNNQLVQVLEGTGEYKVHFIDYDRIEEEIISKRFNMGIVIPGDMGGLISQESFESIKILGIQNNQDILKLKAIIDGYIEEAYFGRVNEANKNLQSVDKDFEVPRMAVGLLTMFMMMFVGTGMGYILEDKKGKTFMRTFCAPLKEHEMVVGNLMANFILGLIQIIVFLIGAKYLLGINWGIPIIKLLAILSIFLITALGIGIGLMGFIKSSSVYSVANTILTTMTCMLGGSFFSPSFMGGTLKKISNFIPQKWFMESYEKLATGSSFADIQLNLVILVLFAAVFFTFGVKVLKPTVEDL